MWHSYWIDEIPMIEPQKSAADFWAFKNPGWG
jgi:hypothetical protein